MTSALTDGLTMGWTRLSATTRLPATVAMLMLEDRDHFHEERARYGKDDLGQANLRIHAPDHIDGGASDG